MTERLRWNDDEKSRVLAAALPLLVADAKMSIVEAVRRVQDTCLPAERRRNLVNIGAVPVELRSALENRRDAATGKVDAVPRAVLAEALERVEKAEKSASAARSEIERLQALLSDRESHIRTLEAHPVPTELSVLEGFCSRVFANATAIGKDIGGVRMERPVLTPLSAPSGGNGRHDPEPQKSERPKLPSVLCIGVRPQDRGRLESKMNGMVRLKFWTDEAYAHLDDKAKGADMCFVMMSMASHDVVSKISRSNLNFQRIPGHAVKRLADEIESWLARRRS